MAVPENLLYSKEHEWVRLQGDVATVGITAYAQEHLGDLVFVELPETGKRFTKGAAAAVVESVKAASDVYAPVSGTVLEVNKALDANPEKLNQSPYGDAWMMKIKLANPADAHGLLSAADYAKLTG